VAVALIAPDGVTTRSPRLGRPLAAQRGRVGSFANKNLALGNFIAADLFLAGAPYLFLPI
jgi:hypothetical protein